MAIKSRRYTQALSLAKQEGRQKEAYALLLSAMEEGDYRAHYAVATWYLHGHFLRQSFAKATRLLRLAAENGVADAAEELAICYEIGCGVVQNQEKAAALYLRALRLGNHDAAHSLERMFHHGIGVARCRPLAAEFAKFAKSEQRPTPMSVKTMKHYASRAQRPGSSSQRTVR